MYRTIRSHKWQETISYYPEDIDWNGAYYVAPGVGDRTGREYDLYFDDLGEAFALRDVRLHNT